MKVDSRGQRLLHRPRRHLGADPGRQTYRHDPERGEWPINMNWGDDDWSTLYFTGLTTLNRIRLGIRRHAGAADFRLVETPHSQPTMPSSGGWQSCRRPARARDFRRRI